LEVDYLVAWLFSCLVAWLKSYGWNSFEEKTIGSRAGLVVAWLILVAWFFSCLVAWLKSYGWNSFEEKTIGSRAGLVVAWLILVA
jgi:hypothetical protein